MKIYLAGSFELRALMPFIEFYILNTVANVSFTSDWYKEEPVDSIKDRAVTDYCGIDAADLVIAMHPYGEGTASEMGYALGSKKKVLFLTAECLLEDIPLPAGILQAIPSRGHIVYDPADLLREVLAVRRDMLRPSLSVVE